MQHVARERTEPRLADLTVWPEATAFTGYLVVVAALAAAGRPEPWLGLAALATVALVVVRRHGPDRAARHALAVGTLAWLFDDGFVADAARSGYAPGALHWHGVGDVAVLGLLIVLCLAAAPRHPNPIPAGKDRHG